MAWLVALDGLLGNARFSLEGPCLVGRGPFNHVVLDDPRISRQHAKIEPESGVHVVYDLNSANGTFVNGQPARRQVLATDDVVRFGPFSFRYESLVEAQEPSPQVTSHSQTMRVREVRTFVGMEAVSRILGSLDAVSVLQPARAGLTELQDADRKLSIIYTFMQTLVAALEFEDLLSKMAAGLMEVFPATEAVSIYLRDDEGPLELRKVAPVGVVTATVAADIVQAVLANRRSILSAPAGVSSGGDAVRGVCMQAPLIYRERVLGMVVVSLRPKSQHEFTKRDLDLLTGLAASAAMALQSLRMHGELVKQQRLQRELMLAEQIQKSFLPRQLPSATSVEFFAEYQPAYSVGGDFYDVFWVGEQRIGMFLGDVVGKGVPAALLMARITSDLRVAALAEVEPAAVLSRVNHLMLERDQPELFVTGVFLTLDLPTGRVALSNGGHLPPAVRSRNGKLHWIDEGAATALGLFEEARFVQHSFVLAPGDTLVLYTDGLVEATNVEGVQFGLDRLATTLHHPGNSARELGAQILFDLKQYVSGAPQYDDLTLLLCGIPGQ